jgi:hypothetical protein
VNTFPSLSPLSAAPAALQPFPSPQLRAACSPGCLRAAQIASAYLSVVGYPTTLDGWVLVVQARDNAPISVPPRGPTHRQPFGDMTVGEGYALGLVLAAPLLSFMREQGATDEALGAVKAAQRPGMLAIVLKDDAGQLTTTSMVDVGARRMRLVSGGEA